MIFSTRPGIGTYLTSLCALSLLMAGAQTQAGQTEIDFNADGFTNASPGSGQYFSAANSHVLALAGDGTSGPISLGFNVTIAGITYSSIFVNENGIVSFGAGLPSGSFSAAADFAALESQIAAPFIAASYANLQTVNGASVFDFGSGTARAVLYQTGLADPLGGTGDPNGHVPGAVATLPSAFSIVWSDGSQGTTFMSQLILYSIDNTSGSFAFRMRYGSPALGQNAVIGALAGYSLGSLTGSFTEPFNPNFDYYVESSGTTTPVPEPGSLPVLALALLTVLGIGRRRAIARRAR